MSVFTVNGILTGDWCILEVWELAKFIGNGAGQDPAGGYFFAHRKSWGVDYL